ncbi:ferrous iron transport protein B [Desulfotruncus alcoholivorax]|nr:ferrous iron transport protein B [Desulfotruncus alcoholivorax]
MNIPEGAKKIVLAGNPNAGKSVFFNYFTGLYVDVSNYPGTTLEISYGEFEKNVLIDTPGVYGISSFNDEERIARDIILSADIVINVVNAVNLERDLFLTQQIIDSGKPVIMALNMIDEAEKNGIIIDIDLLSKELGIPVIPTVAIKKTGLDKVKGGIDLARIGNICNEIRLKLDPLTKRLGSQGEALLVLEGDPAVSARNGMEPGSSREEIYLARRERVNQVIEEVIQKSSSKSGFSNKLGSLMIMPLTGIPILVAALWIMYKIIGVYIAGNIVGFTEGTVMAGIYEPAVRHVVGQIIPNTSILGKILTGEFGILTMTVTYVLGLLLPLVAGFYFFLAIFEDSGYLPRIATLVDRVLTGIGLNGRAVIPLILGFGCVTMASITTRLLSSERERRIAIFLLGLVIPCSAQLGVITGLLAGIGPQYAALYAIIILAVLITVGTVLNNVLPGRSADLLIDLPALRPPRIGNIMKKTTGKTFMFVKEATPLFALGALLISVFQVTGILVYLQNLLAPVTVGWLRLPPEIATVFIMGIVRRDFGAAGLNYMTLTPGDTLVALVTLTLFVPCIASVLVLFKERGRKEAIIMWIATWVIAFFVGGLVAQVLNVFGRSSNTEGIAVVLAFFGLIAIVSRLFKRFYKTITAQI